MGMGTADEMGEGGAVDLDIVEITPPPGHKANILPSPYRLSDAEFHDFSSQIF